MAASGSGRMKGGIRRLKARVVTVNLTKPQASFNKLEGHSLNLPLQVVPIACFFAYHQHFGLNLDAQWSHGSPA